MLISNFVILCIDLMNNIVNNKDRIDSNSRSYIQKGGIYFTETITNRRKYRYIKPLYQAEFYKTLHRGRLRKKIYEIALKPESDYESSQNIDSELIKFTNE